MFSCFNTRYVLYLLAFSLQEVAAQIDDTTRLGLIVGCAVGGVVLLAICSLACCLVCRRKSDKNKDLAKYSYNGTAPVPDSQLSVPSGIWTSSPSMLAAGPPPPPMAYNAQPHQVNRGPSIAQANRAPSIPQKDVKRPKRLPRDGKVYGKDSDQAPQTKPRWQRTLSRAHKALKQIPAVFQVKAASKQTLAFKRDHAAAQENGHHHGRQPKKDSRQEVPEKQQEKLDRANPDKDARSPEKSSEREPNSVQIPPHQHAMQPNFSPQNSMSSTLPRRIEETDEDGSSPGVPAGPYVAKAYSNYRRSYPDQDDPNVARVFSSYTTLDSHRDPYQSRANIHSGKQPPSHLMSKSDAFLQKKGKSVSRTHSDLTKVTSGVGHFNSRPPGHLGGSWNPYGQGVLIRSEVWQPQEGSRRTQSLERKPKAVFVPQVPKQGNGYMWGARPNPAPEKPPQMLPEDTKPPNVSMKPKRPSDREQKKRDHSEKAKPVKKSPIESARDSNVKLNKEKQISSSVVVVGHPRGMPVARQSVLDDRSTRIDVVQEGADDGRRGKGSNSTDIEITEGKAITTDAFKFLEDFEDSASNGYTIE